MAALLEELDRLKLEQAGTNLSKDRRSQMGSGQRGDKVRTLRAQDNTVLDHRSGKRATWVEIFDKGRFDMLT